MSVENNSCEHIFLFILFQSSCLFVVTASRHILASQLLKNIYCYVHIYILTATVFVSGLFSYFSLVKSLILRFIKSQILLKKGGGQSIILLHQVLWTRILMFLKPALDEPSYISTSLQEKKQYFSQESVIYLALQLDFPLKNYIHMKAV